jgi:hypothetical protein
MGMKRSSIAYAISAHLDKWVKTITDEELVKAIKQDAIVTGGCIASMLLGEDVNDFDIYFRTKETAKKVAEYYVNQYATDNIIAVKGADPYKPQVIEKTVTNILGEEEPRLVIYMKSAGVTAEDQSPYSYFELQGNELTEDNFMDSLKVVEETSQSKKKKKTFRPIFITNNAITLSDKTQLIIRFFGEPSELHRNYDFVHAMCYYDWRNKTLEIPAKAMESLLSKTLVYGGSLYPIASIFRVRKFLKRGWRISAGQMMKILFQISSINLHNIDTLREQLIGVDVAYMAELVTKLEASDPAAINDAYLSKLIDVIFDE